ncbi:hypothetical protein F5B22DRAFT_648731 [Xylaria bambusicola]|uniref:uncharacterized protein n=1 Tax=Xylaria bambusicola TaxID=326684 RepID=UPI00200864BC|nr:uncharacterized protein F5B22DRAFT_648731 [Xylaria bambusicola]KAI0509710.1 hypothetical protein F5B22DRAFT_648731 [Xylaria bambusicola]
MSKHISIPLEQTSLLAGSENMGYSTTKVKPKLHIIIPPYSHPVVGQAASDDDLIITMEETSYGSGVSVIYTPCTRTVYCDYCLEQGLDHNLQAYHQRRRSTETDRDSATFDVYLSFYSCILGIIVFLLLFFLYYSGRVDMYSNNMSTDLYTHNSVLPKSLGLDIYL